jgi:hypothetical protein
MFSKHDGAKKCAKDLRRLFANSGFVFPLHKCQSAVARAGGFRDWHDLEAALARSARSAEPAAFRKRLLAVLPEPCRPPVLAWLDKEPAETIYDAERPARWYRDVLPYLTAATALHHSRTPLLRSGSGAGQRLRERLVLGPLLNLHGGTRLVPWFEPDTLAFVFWGAAESLFGQDAQHPRFRTELETLTAAGILDVGNRQLRVFSPDAKEMTAFVAKGKVGKAEYWAEAGGAEATRALHDALATIGVRNAQRVADDISRVGAAAYTSTSGPVLELLTTLAEDGEIETLAKAYGLFASIQPKSAAFIRGVVPARISSGYLVRHRGLGVSKISLWAYDHPDWHDKLKAAIARPVLFASTVDALADSISRMRASL